MVGDHTMGVGWGGGARNVQRAPIYMIYWYDIHIYLYTHTNCGYYTRQLRTAFIRHLNIGFSRFYLWEPNKRRHRKVLNLGELRSSELIQFVIPTEFCRWVDGMCSSTVNSKSCRLHMLIWFCFLVSRWKIRWWIHCKKRWHEFRKIPWTSSICRMGPLFCRE